jgi:hypothetical protein
MVWGRCSHKCCKEGIPLKRSLKRKSNATLFPTPAKEDNIKKPCVPVVSIDLTGDESCTSPLARVTGRQRALADDELLADYVDMDEFLQTEDTIKPEAKNSTWNPNGILEWVMESKSVKPKSTTVPATPVEQVDPMRNILKDIVF